MTNAEALSGSGGIGTSVALANDWGATNRPASGQRLKRKKIAGCRGG
jgi:hypothetical protein